MSILSRFKGIIEEKLPKDPERLGLWLESQSPEVARRFLGYASGVMEPHHLGMGIEVKNWNDDGIQLKCPLRWTNRNRHGQMHWGVLISAGELTLQLFWQRHLLAEQDQLNVISARTEFEQPVSSNCTLCYNLSAIHREQILFRGRGAGSEFQEVEVVVFNESERRLGSLIYNISLNAVGVLSAGPREL